RGRTIAQAFGGFAFLHATHTGFRARLAGARVPAGPVETAPVLDRLRARQQRGRALLRIPFRTDPALAPARLRPRRSAGSSRVRSLLATRVPHLPAVGLPAAVHDDRGRVLRVLAIPRAADPSA